MYEDLLLEKTVLPFLSNLDTELDRSVIFTWAFH
jgi:hypothetical protein